jgi:thioredoxin reductase (NADPH)
VSDGSYDVVVVGGGPVGLYAGFRSALLLLRTHVVDKGRKWSRGYHVPMYHTVPTHPEGMAGKDLINQLRKGLDLHKNYVSIDDFVTIEAITRHDDLFVLKGIHHPTKHERTYTSRVVFLATGVVDRQPLIDGELTPILPYANNRLLCYCVLCDSFLVPGKDAAVIGNGKTTLLTALDLLSFKATKVTILTHGTALIKNEAETEETTALKKKLTSNGVDVVTDEILSLFGLKDHQFGVRLANGREMLFDIAFSAMGFHKINNDLAIMLGGTIDDTGYVIIDDDSRVLDADDRPIPGLYAIGDVTTNWNQLMTGFGDADKAIIHAWANYL